MRIVTMVVITLLTGFGAIGAWVMLGSKPPPKIDSGGEPANEITRERVKRRSAPYIILAPAVTLPEKVTSAPAPTPEPPAVKKAPLAASAPSPEPKPPPAPAAPQSAKPPPAAKSSSLARQTLEAVVGVLSTPEPAPRPELRPLIKPLPVVNKQQLPEPEPAPEPLRVLKPPETPKRLPATQVKPEPLVPAAPPQTQRSSSDKAGDDKKPPRQLTYKVETSRQDEVREKRKSLSAGEKVRFRRVVPLETGRLESDDGIIVLDGIDALASGAQCKYASGKSWECGRWGKYALRRLIRGRAVVCDLIREVSQTEITGRCEVSGVDINKWVVRRGWGQPAPDVSGSYAAALKAARKDKLGQWSEEPKKPL